MDVANQPDRHPAKTCPFGYGFLWFAHLYIQRYQQICMVKTEKDINFTTNSFQVNIFQVFPLSFDIRPFNSSNWLTDLWKAPGCEINVFSIAFWYFNMEGHLRRRSFAFFSSNTLNVVRGLLSPQSQLSHKRFCYQRSVSTTIKQKVSFHLNATSSNDGNFNNSKGYTGLWCLGGG